MGPRSVGGKGGVMGKLEKFMLGIVASQDFTYRLSKTTSMYPYVCNSYSQSAALFERGCCINCGGFLILSNKDDFVCEDCGESVLYGYHAAYNRIYQKGVE